MIKDLNAFLMLKQRMRSRVNRERLENEIRDVRIDWKTELKMWMERESQEATASICT